MKKMHMIIIATLTAIGLLSGCTLTESTNMETQAESKESVTGEERTTYPAVFKASGAEAEDYNTKLEKFGEGLIQYFTETGQSDKVTGYSQPVKVTTIGWYDASDEDGISKIGELDGESFTENRWTDALKRVYNIDVSYSWQSQATDYDQKLRLDMTAGELPDIFIVRNQTDLMQLAKQGLIWDMTDFIEQYASDYDKKAWRSDENAAMEMASLNGRIYGLPSTASATDNVSYIWFRDDWMQKLGLEYPKTMDDLEKVMEAFVKQDPDGNGKDDTWGLNLYGNDLIYPLKGLYAAFGSYPYLWYEEDGKVIYGGVSEKTKDALSYLAGLYQKGYINPEFVVQDVNKANEYIMNNQVGITYAGHWFGHTAGDLHELNPEASWKCIPLPTGTGAPVKNILKPSMQGWVVVNKNFGNPEIALKMRSLTTYGLLCDDSAWWWYDHNVTWHFSPVRCNVSAFDNLITYQNLQEAYENDNDESLLKAKAVPYWKNLHGKDGWEWELMFGPGDGTPFSVLEKDYNEGNLFWDAFHGEQSELMQSMWSNVEDQRNQFYTNMIIGKVDTESGFAKWVETFNNALSGEQMTEEVNVWFKDHQKLAVDLTTD